MEANTGLLSYKTAPQELTDIDSVFAQEVKGCAQQASLATILQRSQEYGMRHQQFHTDPPLRLDAVNHSFSGRLLPNLDLRTSRPPAHTVHREALSALLRAKGVPVQSRRRSLSINNTNGRMAQGQVRRMLAAATDPSLHHIELDESVAAEEVVAFAAMLAAHPSVTSLTVSNAELTATAIGALRDAVAANRRIVVYNWPGVLQGTSHALVHTAADAAAATNARYAEKRQNRQEAKAQLRMQETLRRIRTESFALLAIEESELRSRVKDEHHTLRRKIVALFQKGVARLVTKELIASRFREHCAEQQALVQKEHTLRSTTGRAWQAALLSFCVIQEEIARRCIAVQEFARLKTLRVTTRIQMGYYDNLQRRRVMREQAKRDEVALRELRARSTAEKAQADACAVLLDEVAVLCIDAQEREELRIRAEELEERRRKKAEQQAHYEAELERKRIRDAKDAFETAQRRERLRSEKREDDARKLIAKARDSHISALREWKTQAHSVITARDAVSLALRTYRNSAKGLSIHTALVPPAHGSAKQHTVHFYHDSSNTVVFPHTTFSLNIEANSATAKGIAETHAKLCAAHNTLCTVLTGTEASFSSLRHEPHTSLKAMFPAFGVATCGDGFDIPRYDAASEVASAVSGSLRIRMTLQNGTIPSEVSEQISLHHGFLEAHNEVSLEHTADTLSVVLPPTQRAQGYDADFLNAILHAVEYTCSLEEDTARTKYPQSYVRSFSAEFVLVYPALDEANVRKTVCADLFASTAEVALDTTGTVSCIPPYVYSLTKQLGVHHEGRSCSGSPFGESFALAGPCTYADNVTLPQGFLRGAKLDIAVIGGNSSDEVRFHSVHTDAEHIEFARCPETHSVKTIFFSGKKMFEVAKGHLFTSKDSRPEGVDTAHVQIHLEDSTPAVVLVFVLSRLRYGNATLGRAEGVRTVEVTITDHRGFAASASGELVVRGRVTPAVFKAASALPVFRSICSSPYATETAYHAHLPKTEQRQLHIYPDAVLSHLHTARNRVLRAVVRATISSGARHGDQLSLKNFVAEGDYVTDGVSAGKIETAGVTFLERGAAFMARSDRAATPDPNVPRFVRTPSNLHDEAEDVIELKFVPREAADLSRAGTRAVVAAVQSFLQNVMYRSKVHNPPPGFREIDAHITLFCIDLDQVDVAPTSPRHMAPPSSPRPGSPRKSASFRGSSSFLPENLPTEGERTYPQLKDIDAGAVREEHMSYKAELRVTPSLLDLSTHAPSVQVFAGGSVAKIGKFELTPAAAVNAETFHKGFIMLETVEGESIDDVFGVQACEPDLRVCKRSRLRAEKMNIEGIDERVEEEPKVFAEGEVLSEPTYVFAGERVIAVGWSSHRRIFFKIARGTTRKELLAVLRNLSYASTSSSVHPSQKLVMTTLSDGAHGSCVLVCKPVSSKWFFFEYVFVLFNTPQTPVFVSSLTHTAVLCESPKLRYAILYYRHSPDSPFIIGDNMRRSALPS